MEFILLMICGVSLGYILFIPFRKKLILDRISKLDDEESPEMD
jgi:hypothetical protein